MASDVSIGDSEIVTLTVSPADNTTSATLTVRPPAGSTYPVTATGGTLVPVPGTSPTEYSQVWTATTPVTYNAPGKWVLHWAVTGTGEGTEDYEVFVVPSPTAGGPTWWPGRSRVANYVTHRTLARNLSSTTSSQDTYALTFDSTTTPNGVQVDRLIADGGAWVGMRATPLGTGMYDVASVVVSLYAAAAIERQFPSDQDSLSRADALEKRMDTLLADLVQANNAAGGTGDYGIDVMPVWNFSDCQPATLTSPSGYSPGGTVTMPDGAGYSYSDGILTITT